jgi:hypothetical protein
MTRTKKRHAGTRHSAAKIRSADLISERMFIHQFGPDAFAKIERLWRDPTSDHELIIKDYADEHTRQRMRWGSKFGLPWTIEQSEKVNNSPMERSRASKNTNMPPDHDSITEQMTNLKLMGGTRRRRIHRRRTQCRGRRTHRRRN